MGGPGILPAMIAMTKVEALEAAVDLEGNSPAETGSHVRSHAMGSLTY